jgi:hypothetical protein
MADHAPDGSGVGAQARRGLRAQLTEPAFDAADAQGAVAGILRRDLHPRVPAAFAVIPDQAFGGGPQFAQGRGTITPGFQLGGQFLGRKAPWYRIQNRFHAAWLAQAAFVWAHGNSGENTTAITCGDRRSTPHDRSRTRKKQQPAVRSSS